MSQVSDLSHISIAESTEYASGTSLHWPCDAILSDPYFQNIKFSSVCFCIKVSEHKFKPLYSFLRHHVTFYMNTLMHLTAVL